MTIIRTRSPLFRPIVACYQVAVVPIYVDTAASCVVYVWKKIQHASYKAPQHEREVRLHPPRRAPFSYPLRKISLGNEESREISDFMPLQTYPFSQFPLYHVKAVRHLRINAG